MSCLNRARLICLGLFIGLILMLSSCSGASGKTSVTQVDDGSGVGIGDMDYELVRVHGMDCIIIAHDGYNAQGLAMSCDWENRDEKLYR